jgi:hypothetical protein
MVEWMLTMGTVDPERFPMVPINMARFEVADILDQIADVDIGDFVEVVNLPSFLTSDPIQQLAFGYTETLNAFVWNIQYNAVPEAPYGEGNPPTW